MINKRLVNCDFLNESSFTSCLSNKAKLVYFLFLTNADDKGFVGNGKDIAETLDRCEETFENTLFAYKHTDAISELVDRRFVYEFKDKVGNSIYLIKHWFLHNKDNPYGDTNYKSLLKKVELIDGEYQMKNHEEGKPLKEKEIKVKQNKDKSNSNHNDCDIDSNALLNNNSKEYNWDEILDDIEESN